MQRVMERAKKEIADAKAKLSEKRSDSELTWEARRLLRLYAEGFHDWCAVGQRKPLSWYYRHGMKYYGEKLRHPETITRSTLYSIGFFAYFRGQPDKEKQEDSTDEFWLLAREIAPKACEELIMHKGHENCCSTEELEAAKEFLKDLDEVLAEPMEDESPKQKENTTPKS